MAGRAAARHAPYLAEVEGEIGGALPLGHRGARDPCDVAVQRVGGFEHRDAPPGAAVGETEGLEDLVGAVGGEDLVGVDIVERGDGRAQLARGTVGVPVPFHPPQLVGERVDEAGGGGTGASLVLSRTFTSTCGEW